MPAGRPPIFNSVQEADLAISNYFNYIKGESKIEEKQENGKTVKEEVWIRYPEYPSITGLALYLGFASRQSFYDYEKESEFSYTIKRARLTIEAFYEQGLNKQSPTGAIFALKNFGWNDKQEIDQKTEHSGSIAIKWEDPDLPDTEDKGSAGEL